MSANRFMGCHRKLHGAPNTNRTCDLPLRRGLLYPLSYRGVGRYYKAVPAHDLSIISNSRSPAVLA